MDVESLAKQLILKGMTEEQQKAILDSIKTTMTQARTLQKQRVGENVQVVVQALKKLETDIRDRYDEVGDKIEKRVATIKDGKDGRNGANGKDGKDGRPGRDGAQGPRGTDGLNGSDGRDGEDGVSVTDAHIDFDGSLVISLSSGRTINVGEVVAPDLAEKIKVITNGGGTSQVVLDTLASLQTQIDNIQGGGDVVGPAVSTDGSLVAFNGATGKLIKQAATVTVTQGGTGQTTAAAAITALTGAQTSGYYLRSNGTNAVLAAIQAADVPTLNQNTTGTAANVTGTVAVANGGTGTATPALVAGTNVTITGSWPNQTINASGGGGGSGTVTSVDVSGGTTGLTTSGGPVTTTGTITLSGTLAIANGGTGATTRQAAMDALAGSTTSGQYLRGDGTDVVMSAIQAADVPTLNQDTTGTASNVTGTVAVANGGTGRSTLTANNVLLGNGTSTVNFVAPSTSGNVLTSNGSTWTSAAPSAALPAAAAVGAYALMLNNTGSSITLGSSAAGSGLRYAGGGAADWSNSNQASSGTWRLMSGGALNGGGRVDNNTYGLFLRIA